MEELKIPVWAVRFRPSALEKIKGLWLNAVIPFFVYGGSLQRFSLLDKNYPCSKQDKKKCSSGSFSRPTCPLAPAARAAHSDFKARSLPLKKAKTRPIEGLTGFICTTRCNVLGGFQAIVKGIRQGAIWLSCFPVAIAYGRKPLTPELSPYNILI